MISLHVAYIHNEAVSIILVLGTSVSYLRPGFGGLRSSWVQITVNILKETYERSLRGVSFNRTILNCNSGYQVRWLGTRSSIDHCVVIYIL